MAQKLSKPFRVETAFDAYTLHEIVGEGGAGKVFGGAASDGRSVALKILSGDRASSDRRKRFANETAFLLRNSHPNIVTVSDHGVSVDERFPGSFYVMNRYEHSLRTLLENGLTARDAFSRFLQIMDGVEAAHLLGAVHRDLKPENVLSNESNVAVADWGCAQFSEHLMQTRVKTGPSDRLANFQYAAPEQRKASERVGRPADLFALGLILHEMLTGVIPHGTDYALIEQSSPEYAYLDPIVKLLLKNNPNDRPQTISEIKGLIQRHHAEQISLQKLSSISREVIKIGDVEDPLAFEPPKIANASWDGNMLNVEFDQPISDEWVAALNSMGSYEGVYGRGPETFHFAGKVATVPASEGQARDIMQHLRNWLPKATSRLKFMLEQRAIKEAEARRRAIDQAREQEERLLRVNRSLQF